MSSKTTVKPNGEKIVNMKNFKRALEHFKQMPEKNFDMSWYMMCPLDKARAWGVPESEIPPYDELNDEYIRDINAKYGEVPCGTVSCAAGEIQLEFAKTKKQKEEYTRFFAQDFLGIDSDDGYDLFENSFTYGKCSLKDVTLQDVIDKFEQVIETGWI